MLTVSELFIYPIKSLGGIAVSNALVTDRGLQYDRRWMLIDDSNIFLTQREWAVMALFEVMIKEDGLLVTYKPDGAAVLIPFEPQTKEILTAAIWSDRCKAQVVSNEVNQWFSDILGFDCRLV